MFYVLRSDITKMFYSFGGSCWVKDISSARKYRPYNPLRFLALAYLNAKKGDVSFHKVIPLKATVKMDKVRSKYRGE